MPSLAVLFYAVGLMLVVCVPIFGLGENGRFLQIIGAIGMIVGCVLFALGR